MCDDVEKITLAQRKHANELIIKEKPTNAQIICIIS